MIIITFFYNKYKEYQRCIQLEFIISLQEIVINLQNDMLQQKEQETNNIIDELVDSYYYRVKKINRQDCSICLNNIGKNKKLFITNCNHHFHKSCIKQLLKIDDDIASCPNCRGSIFHIV